MSAVESSAMSVAGPVAGLAIGVLLIAIVEYSASSFSCEEDAARVLLLPVLGMVPVIAEPERRRRRYRTAAITAIKYVVLLSAIAVFVWGLLT